MIEVWPQLRGVRVSHGWKGRIGFTFDHLPHMSEISGVHCSTGNSIANMVLLGYQIALKILGRQERRCGFDSLAVPSLPTYRGTPWFLPIVGGYYNLRDRLDRAAARRSV